MRWATSLPLISASDTGTPSGVGFARKPPEFLQVGDVMEAEIEKIEEHGAGGVDFTMWGRVASTELRGAYFTGSYNCESRTGRLALKTAA